MYKGTYGNHSKTTYTVRIVKTLNLRGDRKKANKAITLLRPRLFLQKEAVNIV